MIGELMALVVLHHALGGDELDGLKEPRRTPFNLQWGLTISYWQAQIADIKPLPFQYQAVSGEPHTGGAIWDCRMRLKQVMSWAYYAHWIGGIFQKVNLPWVGWAFYGYGTLIVLSALDFEVKVYEEWLVLDTMESLARVLRPITQALQNIVIPGMHLYVQAQTLKTPYDAEHVATELGQRNAVGAALFPGVIRNPSWPLLQLPVTSEPQKLKNLTRSQLVRATVPWVRYWRVPLLKFAEDALLLARFKSYYLNRSNEFTLTLCRRMKEEHRVNLFILKDLDLDRSDKGQEPWTKATESRRADNLFALVGFAHRRAPRIFSYGIFRQANPDGLVTYAQAMLYNANAPVASRLGMQPVVGWDTLNWAAAMPEFSWDLPQLPDCPIAPVPEPVIRLNWQAKLTPTTRLSEATFHSSWLQSKDVGGVMRRLAVLPLDLDSTH
jgi:hypothetical protein